MPLKRDRYLGMRPGDLDGKPYARHKLEFRGVPGAALLNKLVGSRAFAKRVVPITQGRDLVVHCAAEMNHLASCLPDLYADYHTR